jgi:hypothetical protein
MSNTAISNNALVAYDMCMAIEQGSINTMLESALDKWKVRLGWGKGISILLEDKDEETGKIEPTGEKLEFQLDSIKVDFNVKNAKAGQIKVVLDIAGGANVSYYPKGKAKLSTNTIEEPWSISFLTDLSRDPVDLKLLKAIEPETHKEVEKVIENGKSNGLSDSVFSIEYLFMKFTNLELMIEGNREISRPKITPSTAEDVVMHAIDDLLKGKKGFNNQFMLGTVVRRNDRTSAPTLALTDFVFHVHGGETVSSLDYLGMFKGKALPNESDHLGALGAIKEPWIKRENVDGSAHSYHAVLAISRENFLENYLMHEIRYTLAPNAATKSTIRRDGNTYIIEYNGKTKTTREDSNFAWKFLDHEKKWWNLTFTLEPGTGRIHVNGRLFGASEKKQISAVGIGDSRQHLEASRGVSGTIELQGIPAVDANNKPIPEKFRIQPVSKFSFAEEFKLEKDEKEGMVSLMMAVTAKIGDTFGVSDANLFKLFESLMKKNMDRITGRLQGRLDQLNVTFENFAFVPPGGGVFSFSNPHFSAAGDLMVFATYIAP